VRPRRQCRAVRPGKGRRRRGGGTTASVPGGDPEGGIEGRRLGALRQLAAGSVRYGAGSTRPEGPAGNRRDQGDDQARACLPDRFAGTRWVLAGNDAAERGRKLRPTAVDDGLGDDGAAGDDAKIVSRLRLSAGR